MTMVPLLLISIINENSQVSFDKPVKALRYVFAVADIMSAAKVQFGTLVLKTVATRTLLLYDWELIVQDILYI